MIRYELLSFRCFSVLTGLILYNAKCRSLRKWPKLFVFSDPPIMTWFLPRLKYPGAGAAPAWREKLVIVTIRIVFLSQQIQLLLSLLSLLFWLKLIYVMPYSHLFTFWKMRHATLFAWCKGYFSQGHQHKATQYENSNIRIRIFTFITCQLQRELARGSTALITLYNHFCCIQSYLKFNTCVNNVIVRDQQRIMSCFLVRLVEIQL